MLSNILNIYRIKNIFFYLHCFFTAIHLSCVLTEPYKMALDARLVTAPFSSSLWFVLIHAYFADVLAVICIAPI